MIEFEQRPSISSTQLFQVTNSLAYWLPGNYRDLPLDNSNPATWNDQEWEAAVWVVYWQNSLPWLAERIREEGIKPPTTVYQQIAEIEKESRERTRRMLDNVIELGDALDKAGIQFIPLKGAALAPLYYPDPLVRPMGDIDLLVCEKDIGRGVEVMRRLGYRFYSRSAEDEVYLRGKQKPMIWAADNVHPVEMHYTLREEYAGLGYDLAGQVWRSAQLRPSWQARELLLPDDATLLHHVCAHATSDWMIQRGRLMQIDDIRKICARMSSDSWQEFIEQIEPFGARFVYPTLVFTAKYSKLPLPENVMDALKIHCPPGLLAWVQNTELADNSESSLTDRSGLGFDIANRVARSRKEKTHIWFRSFFPRRWNLSKRYPRLVETPAWPLGYLLINANRIYRLAQKRIGR